MLVDRSGGVPSGKAQRGPGSHPRVVLGHICPSLYDLRNLFQVNVEEGRHLWAMVYLLHSYFGRDGRDEAEELLARQSGNRDKPRILDAFNEPIDTWLDFFMFTMFTDRDGKSQLLSLSESSLDPLSRTTRFMLTEEAHHMFVGESGIARILERTCQLLRDTGFSGDVRKAGGIDLQILGIGGNGHVAFNEPGSRLDSRTRRVALSPETLAGLVVDADLDVVLQGLSDQL